MGRTAIGSVDLLSFSQDSSFSIFGFPVWPETFQAGDVPGRKAVVPGGANDPVDVVARGRSRFASRGDVAERRPPLAVQGFDQRELDDAFFAEELFSRKR
jgi:hypothetical protein